MQRVVRKVDSPDATIAAIRILHDSLSKRTARAQALTSMVVGGGDPANAAASLATVISDAAIDAGVKLGAVQPRVDSEPRTLGTRHERMPQAYAVISAQGDAIGDVVSLTQFLAELEHGPMLLAVRDLSITQAEPAATSDRMETLRAEFTIVGLARIGAKPDLHVLGAGVVTNASTHDRMIRSNR
jgi:hypothetical protein